MKKRLVPFLKLILLRALEGAGLILVLAILLSFTSLPYRGVYWLGKDSFRLNEKPSYIIMLGAGGMPEATNLLRAYYLAEAAQKFPESKIIISHPGNIADSLSSCRLIARELVRKGIDSHRIIFENQGVNTRSQVLLVRSFDGEDLRQKPILVVTSTSHIKRAILCFRKAGFMKVEGLAAETHELEADLSHLEQAPHELPSVGLGLRYDFWSRLQDEIIFAREIAALFYYRIKGWI